MTHLNLVSLHGSDSQLLPGSCFKLAKTCHFHLLPNGLGHQRVSSPKLAEQLLYLHHPWSPSHRLLPWCHGLPIPPMPRCRPSWPDTYRQRPTRPVLMLQTWPAARISLTLACFCLQVWVIALTVFVKQDLFFLSPSLPGGVTVVLTVLIRWRLVHCLRLCQVMSSPLFAKSTKVRTFSQRACFQASCSPKTHV